MMRHQLKVLMPCILHSRSAGMSVSSMRASLGADRSCVLAAMRLSGGSRAEPQNANALGQMILGRGRFQIHNAPPTETIMSEETKLDNIEGLKKYYNVTEGPEQNEFWCKRCKRGWALSKTNNHPGNYLHLLNHAYSHEKK